MMLRCTRCVMPSSRPDVPFVHGVCAACLNKDKIPILDWEERHSRLLSILDRCDGRVIVPSSGGKDSSYIALRLKELGADVTAVTATTCHLTPIGRANIDNLAKHVRTVEVTPNMSVRAKLNRLALEMVGDCSWPEHVSIHRVPFRVAMETKTHALFYGESPTMTYGGPLGTEDIQTMSQRWASEFAGFLGLRASDFVGLEGITERDMADYMAPTDAELKSADVTAYFLGALEPWDSHRNARVAAKHGMKQELPSVANLWIHENLDSAQVAIHDRLMWHKFAYGRGCMQASIDVRNGVWSRSEAMAWVEKHDHLMPEVYAGVLMTEVLDRMGLKTTEFWAIAERFTNKALHAGQVAHAAGK